jgi:tRNA (guanine-N7-)-methyltransferase
LSRLVVSVASGDLALADLAAPLPLDALVPGGPWEIEIGFGKGRYLLSRAIASPERRFLGIEVAAEYHRLFVGRARRRAAVNWMAIRGEALYLAGAVLPRGFAAAVHVYFPDPWPKSRHQKRRLFDPETVDLVLGLLRPGGRLAFATDFLAYGEQVAELLAGCPGLAVERRPAWPEGPRTHYEAKYEAEGRPIIRLEARLEAILAAPAVLHPRGVAAVVGPVRLDG